MIARTAQKLRLMPRFDVLDIVQWQTYNEVHGTVVEVVREHPSNPSGLMYRVRWTTGYTSLVYPDEIEEAEGDGREL